MSQGEKKPVRDFTRGDKRSGAPSEERFLSKKKRKSSGWFWPEFWKKEEKHFCPGPLDSKKRELMWKVLPPLQKRQKKKNRRFFRPFSPIQHDQGRAGKKPGTSSLCPF